VTVDDTVYLDYAATSAVRPDAVVEAVSRYLREVGATPGRAGHRRARGRRARGSCAAGARWPTSSACAAIPAASPSS
jgi:cysteine sulfinate desulfinase/cysteine desulfurase-like protein